MSQTIGRYKVETTIGQGGMGVVYKAYDPVLRRVVALKVLSGETSVISYTSRFNCTN